MITSGARARELEYKGENIFYVRNVEDGDRIKEFIDKNNPKSTLCYRRRFYRVRDVRKSYF